MSEDHAPAHAPAAGGTNRDYWMLLATPPESAVQDDVDGVLPEHLRWLGVLEDRDQLFLSGPLLSGPGVRYGSGVIVLRAADEAEARSIAAQDPLVRAGLRDVAVHRWRVNEGSVSLRLSLIHGTYRWA